MKKGTLFLAAVFLLFPAAVQAKTYESKGEVTSVDPLYHRLTIRHEAIAGFASEGETEFSFESKELVTLIHKNDLVSFSFRDDGGDAVVEKIIKTGTAPPKDERLPIGKAVQDVLVATGEVAKGVTTPIEPAHEIVSNTVGATTDATGSVLDNVTGPETKQKF